MMSTAHFPRSDHRAKNQTSQVCPDFPLERLCSSEKRASPVSPIQMLAVRKSKVIRNVFRPSLRTHPHNAVNVSCKHKVLHLSPSCHDKHVYASACIQICIDVYMYIHTYVHVHTYIPTYLPTYLPTHIPTYLRTYLPT